VGGAHLPLRGGHVVRGQLGVQQVSWAGQPGASQAQEQAQGAGAASRRQRKADVRPEACSGSRGCVCGGEGSHAASGVKERRRQLGVAHQRQAPEGSGPPQHWGPKGRAAAPAAASGAGAGCQLLALPGARPPAGSCCHPPMAFSGMAKVAPSVATRWDPATVKPTPKPIHTPLTSATKGAARSPTCDHTHGAPCRDAGGWAAACAACRRRWRCAALPCSPPASREPHLSHQAVLCLEYPVHLVA
jgi:hypothetical protein